MRLVTLLTALLLAAALGPCACDGDKKATNKDKKTDELNTENQEMVDFCTELNVAVKEAEADCDKMGDGMEAVIASNKERLDDYNKQDNKYNKKYEPSIKICNKKLAEIREAVFDCNRNNEKVQQAIRDYPALH